MSRDWLRKHTWLTMILFAAPATMLGVAVAHWLVTQRIRTIGGLGLTVSNIFGWYGWYAILAGTATVWVHSVVIARRRFVSPVRSALLGATAGGLTLSPLALIFGSGFAYAVGALSAGVVGGMLYGLLVGGPPYPRRAGGSLVD
jgi:hypothetical protein